MIVSKWLLLVVVVSTVCVLESRGSMVKRQAQAGTHGMDGMMLLSASNKPEPPTKRRRRLPAHTGTL